MYNSNFKRSCRPHNRTSNIQKNVSYELRPFVCSLPTFTILATTKFTLLLHWQFLCPSLVTSSSALLLWLASSNNLTSYLREADPKLHQVGLQAVQKEYSSASLQAKRYNFNISASSINISKMLTIIKKHDDRNSNIGHCDSLMFQL